MASFEEALEATRLDAPRPCVVGRLIAALPPDVAERVHAAMEDLEGISTSHMARALTHMTGQKVNRASVGRHRAGDECGCGPR